MIDELDGASVEAWQHRIDVPCSNKMRQAKQAGWSRSMEDYVLVVDDEPETIALG